MTEPLLAVILATSSSRGSNIVFRWPNNPKVFKRYSKVKYYADRHHSDLSHDRAHSRRPLQDEDIDPIRQKAKWDRHDEEEEEADHSDDYSQSDTPSSSDNEEDSDASVSDEDELRSARKASLAAPPSNGKTKASAASRSKSKTRRPLQPLSESAHSIKPADKSQQQTNKHQQDSGAGGTSHNLSPEEKARQEEKAAKVYRNYLGYELDFLASILSPRQELAYTKFELVVDDLAFLGHPVCVGKGGQWGPVQEEGGTEDESPRGRSRQASFEGQDTPTSLRPSSSHRSISQARTEQSTTSSTRSLASLTQFHLVLVLDRPDPSPALAGMELTSWLQLFYDNIVFKITAALFAEQVRADYVSKESEKLLALCERCMDDGQPYSAYAAQCLGLSSLARCLRDMHKSISTSSDAFLIINDRIEVHLQLPPILQDPAKMLKVPDIETELDPNDPIFLSGGGFAGMGKGADGDDRLMSLSPHELTFEEWTRTTGPYLLPWKTMLLLHDHPDDLPTRGSDGSVFNGSEASYAALNESQGFEQFTRRFTSLFRPKVSEMLNLSEVADILGWDLYQDVYPMVRHLIYYRQARVIDVPRTGHVYGISPLFDCKRLPTLSRQWSTAFPDLPPFPAFLSTLSSALRPLNSHFPGRYQRQPCLDVLIWLLRREAVVKLHVRLRLVATENAKRRAIERRAERAEKRHLRKQRWAEREAKQMRRNQEEEMRTRRREPDSEQDQRGRSKERDRSQSADNRLAKMDDPPPVVSGLSVTRPSVLNEPQAITVVSAKSKRSQPLVLANISGGEYEQLKFERRPVLRSRSPSTILSASFSNSATIQVSRPRTGSPSSGRRFDSISMNPNRTGSKSSTRGRTTEEGASSLPLSRKGKHMSRSPSRARLRIRGFGQGESVEIEEQSTPPAEEDRRLSLVGEEEETLLRSPRLRRISIASERPDIAPSKEEDEDTWMEESSSDSDEDELDDLVQQEYDLGETLIVEPSRASREENDWIASMVEDRDAGLVRGLFR